MHLVPFSVTVLSLAPPRPSSRNRPQPPGLFLGKPVIYQNCGKEENTGYYFDIVIFCPPLLGSFFIIMFCSCSVTFFFGNFLSSDALDVSNALSVNKRDRGRVEADSVAFLLPLCMDRLTLQLPRGCAENKQLFLSSFGHPSTPVPARDVPTPTS